MVTSRLLDLLTRTGRLLAAVGRDSGPPCIGGIVGQDSPGDVLVLDVIPPPVPPPLSPSHPSHSACLGLPRTPGWGRLGPRPKRIRVIRVPRDADGRRTAMPYQDRKATRFRGGGGVRGKGGEVVAEEAAHGGRHGRWPAAACGPRAPCGGAGLLGALGGRAGACGGEGRDGCWPRARAGRARHRSGWIFDRSVRRRLAGHFARLELRGQS